MSQSKMDNELYRKSGFSTRLQPEAIYFLNQIQFYHRYLCVAGSAPLVQYIDWMSIEEAIGYGHGACRVKRKATNNDIDVFLPTFVHHEEQQSCRVPRISLHLPCYSNVLAACNARGITVHNQNELRIVNSALYRYSYQNHGMLENAEFHNIEYVHNVRITKSDFFPNNIQLVFIRCRRGSLRLQDWASFVVGRFDVDVAKVTLHHLSNSGSMTRVKMPIHVRDNINQGKFSFTFVKPQRFLLGYSRMLKYHMKGFYLNSLGFHNHLHPEYIQHILDRFRCFFSPQFLESMECHEKLPPDVRDHILSFVSVRQTMHTNELLRIRVLEENLQFARAHSVNDSGGYDRCGNPIRFRYHSREILRRKRIVSVSIIEQAWLNYQTRNNS